MADNSIPELTLEPTATAAELPELKLDGVVSSIARVGDEKSSDNSSGDAQYSAYVEFTPVDSVRLDMSVVVYTQPNAAGDDDFEDEDFQDDAVEDAEED